LTPVQPSQPFHQPLQRRARSDPEAVALVIVEEDGRHRVVTAGDLHRSARAGARALARHGVERGDLVILVMRHSLELIQAFLATSYRGAIPSIFSFLTPKLDPETWRRGVRRQVTDTGARAIVTSTELGADLRHLPAGGRCRVLDIASLFADAESSPAGGATAPEIESEGGERAAFIQFSSGTTGRQKGVTISHRAVLNNIRARRRVFDLRPDDVVVSWLPLYHDMGLISGLILPLVTGIRSILFSPFDWVRQPGRLFRLIHEYRGTLCWMPNFALNHSLRSVRGRDLEGVDLSCWRLLINGSEPVRQDSMRRFVDRFAAFGFTAEAMVAGYGLAENTVGVSASAPDRPPTVDWIDLHLLQHFDRAVPKSPAEKGATPIVGCGPAYPGTDVCIVDTAGGRLEERHIGEILIRGDSLFSGYYRQPELTASSFTDGWFHTGDLGYLVAGELHICGRTKDLMIVGGRNIHPQDVEAIANDIDGLRPGRSVAFSLPDDRLGSEAIVVVCEPRKPLAGAARDDLERRLRQALVRQLDIVPRTVALVDSGWVVKTPSGKLARTANREKWLRS